MALSLEQTTWLRKNYAVKLAPNSSGTPVTQSNMNLSSAGTNQTQTGSISSGHSTIIAGAGPSMGGALLIHNDKMSASNLSTSATCTSASNKTNNTTEYGESTSSTNSNTTGINNSAKLKSNGSTFSDVENGKLYFINLSNSNAIKIRYLYSFQKLHRTCLIQQPI